MWLCVSVGVGGMGTDSKTEMREGRGEKDVQHLTLRGERDV